MGSIIKKSTKNLISQLGFEVSRKEKRGVNTADIQFLHIGKCAGTQISALAEQINAKSPDVRILTKNHDCFLKDIHKQSRYFFSIRNPINRFMSGFYSRKRKGDPQVTSDWTMYDKLAFEEFEHANDLAESLFSGGSLGAAAFGAMKSIRHTAQNQSDWFYCTGNFLRLRPPVWIIRQEKFDADFQTFLSKSGLGVHWSDLEVKTDPKTSHANDYSSTPPLSERARANLKAWYIQDFEFYRACESWMEAQGGE